jgi:DNA-directed RNA polymerase sigma subunit (sigma70/sigma32)
MTMPADDLTAAPPQDLPRLPDLALLSLIRLLPRSSQRAAACEVLVARYQPLVRSCARKYRGSPESLEELMQVGYVGLMKAISVSCSAKKTPRCSTRWT